MLRRHAFADAPNTSVVLCFPGEEGQDGEWRSGNGGGRYRKKMRAVQRRKHVFFRGRSHPRRKIEQKQKVKKSEHKWLE